MGLLDFLKPKWSPGKMTEEDRERRFWLVKVFTSYTAWQRCRDRYAIFVDLLERQCKEEAVGRLSPTELAQYKAKVERWVRDEGFPPAALNNLDDVHRTEWGASNYADALRGLTYYDLGLEKLNRGDRSVFLHNSQGLLEDAYNWAHHQYEMYYVGGPKGGDGMLFYGKYVPAMKAALLWAIENGGLNAGGLQPAMANLSSSRVWTEAHDIADPRGGKRRMPGSREVWQKATAHISAMPPVPNPVDEVLVRTGEPCPVFGIYEPQVRDGVMDYMCQGQEAFRYGEPCRAPGAGIPVTWKLIWEDTRYRDGVIPEEEKDYYPESNTPPDFSHLVGEELANDWNSSKLVVQQSGEPARYTGTWAAQNDLRGRIFWRKGDPLPPQGNMSVSWVFTGV